MTDKPLLPVVAWYVEDWMCILNKCKSDWERSYPESVKACKPLVRLSDATEALTQSQERIEALERERDAFRKELKLTVHKVITCGVAATHPDANLARTGAYAGADLLPCPFCGGEAVYGANDDPTSGECGMRGIGCATCGAGTAGIFACGDDPKPRLVELWNRREALKPQAPPT